MPLAIRQLSALYLTAASAYTVAILLSHHPALADHAGEADAFVRTQGAEATAAIETYALEPGLKFASHEAGMLGRRIVSALESPVIPAEKRIADAPRRLNKLAANVAGQTQLVVKPKAEAFPPPRDAQFVPPPPKNTPPPSDEAGLRTSEDAPATPTVPNRVSQSNAPVPSTSAQPPVAAETQGASVQGQRMAQATRSHLELAPQVDQSLPPAESAGVPDLPPPTTAEIAQVEQRLKDNLTSEMYENFGLFLYVSKATHGPWAQRMFVFEKEPTGDLALAYNWPVSTGREQVEYNSDGRKLPSFTPQGYYELDPHRLYTHYWSSQWGEPMPYAMFFNWQKDGQQTGLAIHAASGDNVGLLGQRASAGCVRLPPEAARTLFGLIKSKYRGLAPKFAIDRNTGTMSNDGILMHDANGQVQLADGYRVLVFIEDFGGENVVAAMY